MEEVAKILKLPFGRNTMLRKLREQKVFLESNTPKQNLINSGYFKVSEQIIDSGTFKKLVCTTYATSKGIGYIHKIFKNSTN
jgi:phage antirepressor YoqD-like protein